MICDPDNLKTDFFLLRDGPVIVTADEALWQATANWLAQTRKYTREDWTLRSEEEFYREVSKTLCWEQQFGYTPWRGNLDGLNDGASGLHHIGAKRLLIAVDNAERLEKWFGPRAVKIWEVFVDADRMNLLLGVGVLFLVKVRSEGMAARWGKKDGILPISRKRFPGSDVARAWGLV